MPLLRWMGRQLDCLGRYKSIVLVGQEHCAGSYNMIEIMDKEEGQGDCILE